MPRRKSADDYYDDEYAKEQGKLDARRADARRNQYRTGCYGTMRTGCFALLLLPVVLLAAFLAIGAIVSLTGAAKTPTSSGKGGVPMSELKPEVVPTQDPVPEVQPYPPIRPVPPKNPDPKPEPPPLPKVTLTPPKGGTVLLADAMLVLATATKDPSTHAKWTKDGVLRVLTEPTEVEVVGPDPKHPEYTKVKLGGKEWFVYSSLVPAAEKK